MPLDIVTPGFDRANGGALLMVEHRFAASNDGQLLHFTNGDLRATVPPEGWADYAVEYPACADLVFQLRWSA